MKLEKVKNSYNDYKLELSWGQVEAIASALAQNHSDPLADELYAEWQWYMERVPGPGEDEEELKAKQKSDEEGDLDIPMPPGHAAGTPPETGDEDIATPSEEEMKSVKPPAGLPEEPEEFESENPLLQAAERKRKANDLLPEPPPE